LTLLTFGCPTHNTEQILWFWFRITPRRIAYYPRGVIYPSLGTTAVDVRLSVETFPLSI